MGSIMFGIIYFPFVLFNLILLVSPLKVQLGIVNKIGGKGFLYIGYLLVSALFFLVNMIILFLTKMKENHLEYSYDGTQWAGHFIFYLVFWFIQFWQVWSLWCYHHYTRQRAVYLLEANLALKAMEIKVNGGGQMGNIAINKTKEQTLDESNFDQN